MLTASSKLWIFNEAEFIAKHDERFLYCREKGLAEKQIPAHTKWKLTGSFPKDYVNRSTTLVQDLLECLNFSEQEF